MDRPIDDLTTRGLTAWLTTADPATRADAWDRLVATVGADEASRRWLAAFAATDAAET